MNAKLETIYDSVLENSDIVFEMRGNFETYVTTCAGVPGFAIGYNKKSGQYGFKRYDLINTLYTASKISYDNKPNYSKLYEKAKNAYMFQVVRDNIENLDIYD